MSEMLSVKEWAEKAGLKLANYDGFVRIYEELTGESNVDFSTSIENRMRNAGDILCTRRGFQAGINNCTMYFPTIDDYETMLEVIPEFVEDSITRDIFMQGVFSNKKDIRSDAEILLRAMKIKLRAREKRLELNAMTESIKLEDINGRILKAKEIKKIEKYGTTVEEAELKLLHEIINDLENLLKKKRIRFSQLPNEKIEFLTGLYYDVIGKRAIEPSQEEYMFINIPGIPKEPFVQPYRLIGVDGVSTGVAFDIQTDKGQVKGAMRTTSEMDAKIRAKTEKQDEYEDLTGLEEGGQALALLDSSTSGEDGVKHALEIIDVSVSKEERESFMDKFEKFVKRIKDLFRRDGDSR